MYKASIRGIEITITQQEYYDLMDKQPCFYCGDKITLTYGHSLDRLDNTQGYTLTNVVPCCGNCNKLKSDFLTPMETKQVVKLLKQLRGTGDEPPWKPLNGKRR